MFILLLDYLWHRQDPDMTFGAVCWNVAL